MVKPLAEVTIEERIAALVKQRAWCAGELPDGTKRPVTLPTFGAFEATVNTIDTELEVLRGLLAVYVTARALRDATVSEIPDATDDLDAALETLARVRAR